MTLGVKISISFILILIWSFISILIKKIPDEILYKEKYGYKLNKEFHIKRIRRILNLLIFVNMLISIFIWVGSEFTIALIFLQGIVLIIKYGKHTYK
ncbi:hypothetical protein A500_18052 [Clostridium sartagoforme AAU1]|uniref:DUF3784 domain-containing protein n=1 Tax=Clostridium sartagoforme AAU1 TaxID=1202534 RepID=R9BT34_9CLOT|nr:hypothetical protein [Clostridium sartagoforme]EOR20233.1 hypothetical protein A500_18052 [Clostridium sartagoforme AAU1]